MPEILGTEKGLQALAWFLEKTAAFIKKGRPRATEPLLAEELDYESVDGDQGTRAMGRRPRTRMESKTARR
jgi:hypothetical protein